MKLDAKSGIAYLSFTSCPRRHPIPSRLTIKEVLEERGMMHEVHPLFGDLHPSTSTRRSGGHHFFFHSERHSALQTNIR